MVPVCMVNEETLRQVPDDVRQYLRALRSRILDLEQTDAQQRLAEVEAANRKLRAQVEELLALTRRRQKKIHQLQQQLADTQARLKTNSTNSSLPPSSDRFHGKRRPPPDPARPRKQRGGQPGHPRWQRLLVPDDQVRRTMPCKPTACRRCGRPLTGTDPAPLRHQVAELPVVRPEVVEYQLHRLTCSCCHTSTGKLLGTAEGGAAWFTPDGRTLITSGAEGIRFFDLPLAFPALAILIRASVASAAFILLGWTWRLWRVRRKSRFKGHT
jgi:hypothetical protein